MIYLLLLCGYIFTIEGLVFTLKTVISSGYSVDNRTYLLYQHNDNAINTLEDSPLVINTITKPIKRYSNLKFKLQQGQYISESSISSELVMPDPQDPQTVLSLAKMTYDSYYDPKDKNWIPIPGWDIGYSFGWESTGIRGYIFTDESEKTMVIVIKGTSLATPIGSGPTAAEDKYNDNMMFSCCCAKVSWEWSAICSCPINAKQCSIGCLLKESNFDKSYYNLAQTIYLAIREWNSKATSIWMAGHSLGGALGSLVALTNGLPAFSFESPGDLQYAYRLGLLPEIPETGIPPDYTEFLSNLPIYHYGNTQDPIYLGTCTGISSSCYWFDYALETKCHTGYECIYTPELKKRNKEPESRYYETGIKYHSIDYVIKNYLENATVVPECKKNAKHGNILNDFIFKMLHSQMTSAQHSTDAENFFQSDADIAISLKKEKKKKEVEMAGEPIPTSSKVLALLVDNKIGYVGESGHVARMVNLNTGESLSVFKGHSGPVTCLAILGADLFTGSWDKTIRIWNIESTKCNDVLQGHSDFIKSLVLRDSKTLYSSSSDSTIRQWDLTTKKCVHTFKGHKRSVESIIFDGEFLYSGSSDTTIKKWNLITKQCIGTWNGHETSIYSLYMNENYIFSASADKTVKRWDLETEKCVSTFVHDDFVKCAISICDGAYLVTGSRDEIIRIWDLSTDKLLKTVIGHYDEVSCLVCIGSKLYSGSIDCTIRNWNVKDILESKTPEAPIEETINEISDSLLTAQEELELLELTQE